MRGTAPASGTARSAARRPARACRASWLSSSTAFLLLLLRQGGGGGRLYVGQRRLDRAAAASQRGNAAAAGQREQRRLTPHASGRAVAAAFPRLHHLHTVSRSCAQARITRFGRPRKTQRTRLGLSTRPSDTSSRNVAKPWHRIDKAAARGRKAGSKSNAKAARRARSRDCRRLQDR